MSFLLDWFYALFARLGILERDARLVLVGLDNAGKTTLLHLLARDKIGLYAPTERAAVETFELRTGLRVTAFDLGGHAAVRALWRDFFDAADAIVFMVDGADPSRFPESISELRKVCSDEALQNAPLLILFNKSEIAEPVALEEWRTFERELSETTPNRRIKLFPCSLVRRTGVTEAFDWLANQI